MVSPVLAVSMGAPAIAFAKAAAPGPAAAPAPAVASAPAAQPRRAPGAIPEWVRELPYQPLGQNCPSNDEEGHGWITAQLASYARLRKSAADKKEADQPGM
jgi:hypothetical protein